MRTKLHLLTLGIAALTALPVSATDDPAELLRAAAGRTVLVHDNSGSRAQIWGFDTRTGTLGVHLVDLTPELRTYFGSDDGTGVLVGRVLDDAPAATAGVRVGDLIIALDGVAVSKSHDLASRIRPRQDGEEVTLRVIRDRQERELTAVIEERDRQLLDVAPLLGRSPLDPAQAYTFYVDPDTVSQANRRLQELLADTDWKRHMLRFDSSNPALAGRLNELEGKLQKLEQRLERCAP